ncbi:MAG: FtsW/RodA/SpoVE family cell cycle protein, partial [Actinomyces sp.]|nr:FtsW/RodA/SpoVE family cell cycle protein [Actinomyces sp.]
PLTGLTAPFLAAGGSSMVASWVMIALLVRISDAARRPTRPISPSAISGHASHAGDNALAQSRSARADHRTTATASEGGEAQ